MGEAEMDLAYSVENKPSVRALPPLAPNAALRWDMVARMLPTQLGDVLEIGCGRGAITARLARRAKSMTALEPDEESFLLAKANLPQSLRLHNCSTDDLPAESQFDLVCAFEVLEHIENDRAALTAWRGHVRPGGEIMLSTPAWNARMGPWDEVAGHYRRYDPDHIVQCLEQSGYRDVDVQVYGFPAGNALEAVRNRLGKRMLEQASMQSDYAGRTAGSGRLFQPSRGLSGLVTAIAAQPMVWTQRLFPGRGVGLVAKARVPK